MWSSALRRGSSRNGCAVRSAASHASAGCAGLGAWLSHTRPSRADSAAGLQPPLLCLPHPSSPAERSTSRRTSRVSSRNPAKTIEHRPSSTFDYAHEPEVLWRSKCTPRRCSTPPSSSKRSRHVDPLILTRPTRLLRLRVSRGQPRLLEVASARLARAQTRTKTASGTIASICSTNSSPKSRGSTGNTRRRTRDLQWEAHATASENHAQERRTRLRRVRFFMRESLKALWKCCFAIDRHTPRVQLPDALEVNQLRLAGAICKPRPHPHTLPWLDAYSPLAPHPAPQVRSPVAVNSRRHCRPRH